MKKEVIKENGYLFAKISEEEFNELNSIKFDKIFISFDEITKVKEILGVTEKDDLEYVRAIRNSIVRYYSDMIEKCRISKTDNYDFNLLTAYNTKRSAITAALDTILEF